MPHTFHALLFSIPLMVLNAAAPLIARADDETSPAWIELPADTANGEWRDGSKRGWSAVADVHLNADNNRLLVGDPGQGALLSRGESDLYTARDFGDVEVRLEFMVPRNSNSGVKLNGHYEIQIRDTHGKSIDELTGDDCGGVYPRGTRAALQVPRQGCPPARQLSASRGRVAVTGNQVPRPAVRRRGQEDRERPLRARRPQRRSDP